MVVTRTRTTGAKAFAEMARGYGVSHVFFVPTFALRGHAEMNALGIATVSTHGEKAAAYMADGYARVSRRPGICMAQTVGGALLAAGLKDAFMARAPVVAMTGGPEYDTRFRHVYQEVDDYTMFGPVTKWQASVETLERFPELLRQAFRVSTAGAPGPVHLELRGHLGQLLDEETELDTLVEPAFAETPATRPVADEASLLQAASVLASVERPVIVAGGGVIASGAEAELVELAEKLDIPVATSMNAKVVIADTHPLAVGVCGLYSRPSANRTVGRADLVFFVGDRAGSMVTTNWHVPTPGTRVVQLDICAEELGRHYPAEVYLHGDARASLKRLLEIAKPRTNQAWTDETRAYVREWRDEVAGVRASDAAPLRPERVCAEIAAALPSDGAVIVDTLQASIWAASMMELAGPTQRFARCCGSLGWALPAAIGAKAALGARPVVCFTGDGGCYYHISELETAARYGLPVVFIVNNNGAYAGENDYWPPAYGDAEVASYPHWKFGDIDFAAIAREFGCVGIRVDRADQIGEALRRGLASDRPTVIDVVTEFSAYHPKGWTP
jgi:acetolactate synthase-1/2/3 large subunit